MQGTVVHGDAASVTSSRGAVDDDDASIQVDEDMTIQPHPVSRGRDWDRELPLSTDPAAALIRRKSPKTTSILTLRDTMTKPNPTGTAPVVVDNQLPLESVVVQPRQAPCWFLPMLFGES